MIELVLLWLWGSLSIACDRVYDTQWYGDEYKIKGWDWLILFVVSLFWPLLPIMQVAMVLSDKWKQK